MLTPYQHGLPPLLSYQSIEGLRGQQLIEYLDGYGVVPPVGANPRGTNRLRKEALKRAVS
jgi:hypothetical protein